MLGREFDERDERFDAGAAAERRHRRRQRTSVTSSSTRASRRTTSAIAARSAVTSASAAIRARRRRSRSSASCSDSKYTGVRDEIPRQVFFAVLEERHRRRRGDVRADDEPAGRRVRRRPPDRARSSTATCRSTTCARSSIRSISRCSTIGSSRRCPPRSASWRRYSRSIGLYGVMAYTVARRTREIGVRMALGAVPGDVDLAGDARGADARRLGARPRPDGRVGTRAVSSAISCTASPASDPVTIAGACLLLAVVAALAGYIPARRATRVNPVLALRYE